MSLPMAKQDTEVLVIQRVIRELEKLGPEAQERVVSYLHARRMERQLVAKSTVQPERTMSLFGDEK